MFPIIFQINFSTKYEELCKRLFQGFTAGVNRMYHEIHSVFVLTGLKRSHWPWIRKAVRNRP